MANNDVIQLINMLYAKIDDAKGALLGGDKCIINRDEALDLLDEIRSQLPTELQRAQDLIRAREDYVERAKKEVAQMLDQARIEAENRVSESEVLSEAREKSREIVARAEDRCREMYRVTNDYTEDALRRAEEAVQLALEELKQSHTRFRSASAEKMQQNRDKLRGTGENSKK